VRHHWAKDYSWLSPKSFRITRFCQRRYLYEFCGTGDDEGEVTIFLRGVSMIDGIKQRRVVVGKGGKIEIPSSELLEGTTVEIIVLVESSALDETDYLLSNPANRQQLLQAIERAKNPENLVVISALSWEETYRAIATEQEDWSDFDDPLLDGIE